MASTVAHDSHHMIVVGTDKADMAMAANRLGEVGGGVVLVSEARLKALVEMPIAGLMSDERAEIVADKADKLVAAMRAMGCTLNNAYMQHSLLALVVIPRTADFRCWPHRRDQIRQDRIVRLGHCPPDVTPRLDTGHSLVPPSPLWGGAGGGGRNA